MNILHYAKMFLICKDASGEGGGGHWITIGDNETHVFIENGKITAGAKSLQGKSVEQLSQPKNLSLKEKRHTAGQSKRWEQYRQHREQWAGKAKEAGIEPKHLDDLAKQLIAHKREAVEEKLGVWKRAVELGKSLGQANYTLKNPVFERGDYTQLPKFDLVIQTLNEEMPGVLGNPEELADNNNVSAHSAATEKLFAMLQQGKPAMTYTEEDAYAQAYDELKNAKEERDARGPEEITPEDISNYRAFLDEYGQNSDQYSDGEIKQQIAEGRGVELKPEEEFVMFSMHPGMKLLIEKAEQSRGNPKTGNAGQFGPGGVTPKQPSASGQAQRLPAQTTQAPHGSASPQPKQGSAQSQEMVQEGNVSYHPAEAQEIKEAIEVLFPGQNVTPKDFQAILGTPDDLPLQVGAFGGDLIVSGSNNSLKQYSAYIESDEQGRTVLHNANMFRAEGNANPFETIRAVHNQAVSAGKFGIGVIEAVAIREDAGKVIGYKMWPRVGYDGPIPDQVKAKLPQEFSQAKNISDLYATREGRKWWEQNGDSCKMSFDTTPGSYSMTTLDGLVNRGQKPQEAKPAMPEQQEPRSRLDRMLSRVKGLKQAGVTHDAACWEVLSEEHGLDPGLIAKMSFGEALGSIAGTIRNDTWLRVSEDIQELDREHDSFKEFSSTGIAAPLGITNPTPGKTGEVNGCLWLVHKSFRDEDIDIGKVTDHTDAADLQFAIEAPGVFGITGKTKKKLPSGAYRIFIDMAGKVHYVQKEIPTDEIIEFPDSIVQRTVEEIKQFWSKGPRFAKRKFLHKRGILMWGMQGNGKTTAINQIVDNVIRSQNGIAVYCKHPGTFIEGIEQYRAVEPDRPIVAIFEDIDAIIHHYGDDDLLQFFDGNVQVNRLVSIATTNYPARLDPRIIQRPRRFDRIVEVKPPDEKMRRNYFSQKMPDFSAAEINKWVSASDGLPFGALAEMIIAIDCLENDFDGSVKRIRDMVERRPMDLKSTSPMLEGRYG